MVRLNRNTTTSIVRPIVLFVFVFLIAFFAGMGATQLVKNGRGIEDGPWDWGGPIHWCIAFAVAAGVVALLAAWLVEHWEDD